MSRQEREFSDVRQETPASKTQPPGRARRGAARALLPAIDRHQVHKRRTGSTPRVPASESRVSVRAEPARLNNAIASLFMLGASCFALGAIPAYVHAVGAAADAMTFFVGSIFFTSASYCQLLQAQSPGMTGVDEQRQHTRIQALLWAWRPHDKNWLAAATQFPGTLCFNISTFAATVHNLSAAEADKHVWRPDVFGSVLFLVASAYAIASFALVDRVAQHAGFCCFHGVGDRELRVAEYRYPARPYAGQRRNVPRSGVLPHRGGAPAARLAGLGAVEPAAIEARRRVRLNEVDR